MRRPDPGRLGDGAGAAGAHVAGKSIGQLPDGGEGGFGDFRYLAFGRFGAELGPDGIDSWTMPFRTT